MVKMLSDLDKKHVLSETENVKRWIEQRHNIELPDIDVLCSDSVVHAICLSATMLPSATSLKAKQELRENMKRRLQLKELVSTELDGIDLSKFTVFVPRRHLNCPAELCEDVWHEVGHVGAHALGLKDKDYEESFAVTYSLIGLLLGARNGKFSFNEAFDQIERVITKVRLSIPFLPHRWSLKFLEKINPSLEFRARGSDELLGELDYAIQDILTTDKEVHAIIQDRKLARQEKTFIPLLATVAVTSFLFSLIFSLFHLV